MFRSALILGLAVWLSGCNGHARVMNEVRARASFEFNCPEDQIQVSDFGSQMGAKGCGRALKCSDVPFAGLLCQEAPEAAGPRGEPARDAGQPATTTL